MPLAPPEKSVSAETMTVRISMLACQEGSLGADRHVFTNLSTATAVTLILVDNRDDYDPA